MPASEYFETISPVYHFVTRPMPELYVASPQHMRIGKAHIAKHYKTSKLNAAGHGVAMPALA